MALAIGYWIRSVVGRSVITAARSWSVIRRAGHTRSTPFATVTLASASHSTHAATGIAIVPGNGSLHLKGMRSD